MGYQDSTREFSPRSALSWAKPLRTTLTGFLGWVFEPLTSWGDQELTLGALVRLLYFRRRVVLFFALIGLAVSIAWIGWADPLYSATVPIGPSQDSSGSSSSSGSMSSIIRLATGSEQNPEFERFMMQLTSIAVAEKLEQKDRLLSAVFHSEWNARANQWRQPTGFFAAVKAIIRRSMGLPAWSAPDAKALSEFLTDHISVSKTSASEIYNVTFEYQDRTEVGPLLNDIVYEANEIIRQADLAKSRTSEQYLVAKLQNQQSVEVKDALIQLLTTEEKKLLLINNAVNYVAEPLDVINVSKSPVYPNAILLLILGPLIGALLGSFIVFLMD